MDNFVQHQEANGHAINEEVLTLMDENDMHLAEHIDVPKVLGDIFEALIGAIFLDSGMCLETTWKVVHRIMWKEIELFKLSKGYWISLLNLDFTDAESAVDFFGTSE